MNNLVMKFFCHDCPKFQRKIESSGSQYGVDYITFKAEKRYIIEDNPNVSWDEIMQNREKFISIYTPKFGKYEIEEFVGYKLMEALFITKDITDLLNSELLCDDSPYNVTRIKYERLKEELLKCFEIVEKDVSHNSNAIFLMFKWKPWKELE